MMYLLNLMNIMFSMNFITNKHPLSLGLILLTQTMTICLMMNMYMYSAWFSYILFLIMIGGMLVLFIYMTSLASNEMFSMSINTMYFFMLNIIIMSIFMLILFNMIPLMFNNNEMSSLFNFNKKMLESTNLIFKLYNYPSMNLTIFLMTYLLLTLIATMKITKNFSSTLRQMKYV